MTNWAAILLFVALIMVGCGWVIDHRITDCHAKGGEMNWSWTEPFICLSPDGRYIR